MIQTFYVKLNKKNINNYNKKKNKHVTFFSEKFQIKILEIKLFLST